MRCDEYTRWAEQLAAHEPGSYEWNQVWGRLWASPYFPGCTDLFQDINAEARKLYKERRRSLKGRGATGIWVDEVADWSPTYQQYLMRYGRSPIDKALRHAMMYGVGTIKFNTEGEKQMKKIDWSKPLRGLLSGDEYKVVGKATIVEKVKGGNRMILDDTGCDASGGWSGVRLENVPEERFFVGLRRMTNGLYVLTDGGTTTTMSVMEYWRGLVADGPHWIVDTRKSAEPPKAIAHDPEDYVTVYQQYGRVYTSDALMTKRKAQAYVSEPGEQVVRVRTTPAPVDTSRYIQLYRMRENDPWRINARTGGSQEFTWGETKNRGANPLQTAVKVRD